MVYEEEGIGCCHCPHYPTDPNLLLIDCDLPRHQQNQVSRIWILRLSTDELTELAPRDKNPLQIHSAWTWDGQNVIYHGQSAKGGWYIGVVDRKGQVEREYGFHEGESYGHVSAMAGRPAIILDGNVTSHMLLCLYYDQELPRIEIIARHGTNLMGIPWQYSHPHQLSDPTGRWISFNAVRGRGRSDVFIVEV